MAARYHTLILLMSLSAWPLMAAQTVPDGYRQVAQQSGVPADLLYAIALTESGSALPQGIRPWPWTLNIAGHGYRYPTRREACFALHHYILTTSPKRIDIGPGQINLGWHGHLFAAPCDVLIPIPTFSLPPDCCVSTTINGTTGAKPPVVITIRQAASLHNATGHRSPAGSNRYRHENMNTDKP